MDKIWKWHKVNGKIKFYEHAQLVPFLNNLPDEGEAIFRKAKSKRSTSQREYYWAVIVKSVAEYQGEENENMVNEDLKLFFNPKARKDFNGKDVMVGGSIEKESTDEVERIYDKIRIYFLTEHGVKIPLPNDIEL